MRNYEASLNEQRNTDLQKNHIDSLRDYEEQCMPDRDISLKSNKRETRPANSNLLNNTDGKLNSSDLKENNDKCITLKDKTEQKNTKNELCTNAQISNVDEKFIVPQELNETKDYDGLENKIKNLSNLLQENEDKQNFPNDSENEIEVELETTLHSLKDEIIEKKESMELNDDEIDQQQDLELKSIKQLKSLSNAVDSDHTINNIQSRAKICDELKLNNKKFERFEENYLMSQEIFSQPTHLNGKEMECFDEINEKNDKSTESEKNNSRSSQSNENVETLKETGHEMVIIIYILFA